MSGAAVEVGVVGNSEAVVLFANVLVLDASGVIITSEVDFCIGGVVFVVVFVVFPMAVAVGVLAGLMLLLLKAHGVFVAVVFGRVIVALVSWQY